MANVNNTYRNVPRIIGITFIAVILSSTFIISQTSSESRVELPEISVINILNGLYSDNYGLKMSCVYYAGKYKILEVSQDLVKQIESADDEELCQMMIWSLYQIGNESCCEEVQRVMRNHPSEKLRDFCEYLQKIKEYEAAVAKH
jgi:hypothetical protein